ncbi:hypothetical protein F5878DRAFT_565611 [Lentinula raphanica]|uniref:Uncharacterized protein n=1 Tax=Lentinula raphanica TaxID=153919 RepID=A0AA38UBZ0_9AGAR|nr:hypothetical protein F5880DRAFT_1544782 [Lentinula raphanica]KAJ3836461.1 hypothetical protein F5878DRAFT_565611 [Lentinula raphanica]
MHPSVRIFAERVHTPLIRFLGKRSWPSSPETPHAHPFAPSEFQNKNYTQFSKGASESGPSASSSSSSSGSKSSNAFQEFWEAPERFWKPKVHQLEEVEIDAILSGGATVRV